MTKSKLKELREAARREREGQSGDEILVSTSDGLSLESDAPPRKQPPPKKMTKAERKAQAKRNSQAIQIDEPVMERFVVTGTGPSPKNEKIRRMYPTRKEAEADADRCRKKKGYKNITVETVSMQGN